MEKKVFAAFEESAEIKKQFVQKNIALIVKAVDFVVDAFKRGNKLFLFGNGGSAADAQHLAAEFVNRFQIERPPLPALALTTDTSIITSIGNDYHFDDIFAKQIKALGVKGDVAVAISTSGNSENVIKALQTASSMGIKTIGLSGKDGGRLAEEVDVLLNVEANSTPRIQETHITFGHVLCELVDEKLFRPAD